MKLRLTVLMSGLLLANAAFAATEVDLRKQPAGYLQNAVATQNKSAVKIETIRTDVDFNGTAHTRVQQTYQGIPVWGATGVIHTPNTGKTRVHAMVMGTASTMNGRIYEGLEKDLAAKSMRRFAPMNEEQALQAAKGLYAKKTRATLTGLTEEKAKHIIFVDDNQQAHHAYLTSFMHVTPTSVHRPMAIVDVDTQKVYRSWEGILTLADKEQAFAEASANLRKRLAKRDQNNDDTYSVTLGGIGGNEKGEIVYEGKQPNSPQGMASDVVYRMGSAEYHYTICALHNDDITVVDVSIDNQMVVAPCNKAAQAHHGVAWLSNDKGMTRWNDDEMNDGYSPSLDAFYAAGMIKNMYQEWYGVPALIDSEGKPMHFVMRVHFGRKFDNAFWDGKQMTFGDGGRMFYPMASLGVASHEISHGFTETHSGIDYSLPEMGALHESFSDMAALAIENYTTGKNGWDLGREVMKNEGALRYLDNPTKDGRSIDHMKDFDATESHAGAGVTNKAFYLLATSKGWNTRKAFDVWVKANMHYWTSSMKTLNEAACGVVAATRDYGYDLADVRIAFAKVGLDTDKCETH